MSRRNEIMILRLIMGTRLQMSKIHSYLLVQLLTTTTIIMSTTHALVIMLLVVGN